MRSIRVNQVKLLRRNDLLQRCVSDVTLRWFRSDAGKKHEKKITTRHCKTISLLDPRFTEI